MKRRFSQLLRRDTRGATAVEFALIAPMIFMLIFGLIEFGRLYWVKGSIAYALNGSGRYAMLNPTAPTTQVIEQARANLYGVSQSEVNFATSNVTSGGVNYLTVTARVTFEFVPGNILNFGTIKLMSQVRVPLIP